MTQTRESRWVAEVCFLKTHYRYWLVRTYGLIPTMNQNIPADAGEEEVRAFRNIIDECFGYVISILAGITDSNHLSDRIMNEAEELGRIA